MTGISMEDSAAGGGVSMAMKRPPRPLLIRAAFREGAKADVLATNVATTAIVVNFIVDIVFWQFVSDDNVTIIILTQRNECKCNHLPLPQQIMTHHFVNPSRFDAPSCLRADFETRRTLTPPNTSIAPQHN
jgi:hypothetical protein